MTHRISLHDLGFARVPAEFFSERGVPQTKWVRVGMPLIPQNVIDGTFYLYRTREHALAGKHPGGSGFVVRYDGPPRLHPTYYTPGTQHYAVTNWHVACQEGASVIRLNTVDGGTDIIDLGPEDWHFLPGKYDVAATALTLDPNLHSASAVSSQAFYLPGPPEWGRDHIVGVGDDVFMIGLFVDHDGVTTNVPSARFGHVSMLPNPKATIIQETGYNGESWVIDMHSRTGFSGSPVYVYRTPWDDLDSAFFGREIEVSGVRPSFGDRYKGRVHFAPTLFAVLGIHWGQFPERWELKEKSKLKKEARGGLIVDGAYVEAMSGMTCVIPALNILEVLDMPILKGQREIAEAKAAEKPRVKAEGGIRVVRKEVEPAPTLTESADANPSHKEDFTALLGEAAQARAEDD